MLAVCGNVQYATNGGKIFCNSQHLVQHHHLEMHRRSSVVHTLLSAVCAMTQVLLWL